jgi:PelA/Pel-15E family pectate lyase
MRMNDSLHNRRNLELPAGFLRGWELQPQHAGHSYPSASGCLTRANALLVLRSAGVLACELKGRPRPVMLRMARRRPNSQPGRLRYHATMGIAGRAFLLFLVLLFMTAPLHAAESASSFLKRPDDWFRGEEAKRIAENILSWQSPLGSWPKNTNTVTVRYSGDPAQLRGTFDNGATLGELRFLARAFSTLKDIRCEQAFLKGFDHILKSQYSNGGWPQYFPAGKGYPRFITFNDNAMVRLMEFAREVAQSPIYDFLDKARRKSAQESFDRGIQCILKCQIKRDGKLTVWCAQHDEVDFSPRPARTFELASLSGAESVGLVKLLMSLEHPGPDVVQAIDAAVAWFEAAKLTGIRVNQEKDPQSPRGWDKKVVKDPAAPPLWARFYDIETNKPIFVDRDGIPKSSLAEIGYERRNGYAWLGDWPASLLAKDYPAWKQRLK